MKYFFKKIVYWVDGAKEMYKCRVTRLAYQELTIFNLYSLILRDKYNMYQL